MAGDWIKMRADLFTHPKVFKIADCLGKDELYVVGALLAFWAWAHSHAVDGRVDGATPRLVDAATRVVGLSDALLAVGWIEVDDKGISIPRFDEHNSESAKERILKNQRQARWRERKKKGVVDGEASTGATTKATTREEKRREDKGSVLRTGDHPAAAGSDDDPEPPSPPAAPPKPAEPAEPVDPVKAFFDAGLELLRSDTRTVTAKRQMLGKLRKARGDSDAMQVLLAARNKSDPWGYIAASSQPQSARLVL